MSSYASAEPITVAYWATRGLGAPLRMMVMYANHPLNCVLYDYEVKNGAFDGSLWTDAKVSLKEENPLMNIPFVGQGGIKVCQSIACASYIGRKLNMNGLNDEEVSGCEQLLNEVMDLRNKIVALVYGPAGKSPEETKAVFASLMGNLKKLALWYEMNATKGNSGPFMVGSAATVCDFNLWEQLDQLIIISAFHSIENPVASFPPLAAYHSGFTNLPGNKRYFESKLSTLPMNNQMATIGACPVSHGPWRDGMKMEWSGLSGLY